MVKQNLDSTILEFLHEGIVIPAPLSKEVLARCGFEFHEYFKSWQKKTDGRRTDMEINLDYDIVDFLRKPIVKRISSLHQMQNIYFELKGIELKFASTMNVVN